MRRARLAAAALLLCGVLGGSLTACGFQPLYAKKSGGTHQNQGFPQVDIAPMQDRLGQILHNELVDRINPRGVSRSPSYRLQVSAKERRSDIVILRDSTATYAKYVVEATWELVDLASGKPVTKGNNQRTSSFSISSSEFAILQAENDARFRAATELAEDIRLRVALYLNRGDG